MMNKLAAFKASIFDLDGTLVHSEHVWEEAKLIVLANYGITPTKALLSAYVGRGLFDFLDEAFGHPLSEDKKVEIGNQIGAKADILLPQLRFPVEGAAGLLNELQKTGQRIAICSSSPRRHILSAMAELGISDRVDVVISGSELPKGKPHPLPYITTVHTLGLTPLDVCAFEDSLPGARSAHAASLTVFAIEEGCSQVEFDFCAKTAETYDAFLLEGSGYRVASANSLFTPMKGRDIVVPHHISFHGCLFDLDGTLIDSSCVVNRAWSALLTRYGLDPEHYLPLIHGRPAHESIREFLQFAGEDVIKQEIKLLHDEESTDTRGVVPLEGAIDFLQRLTKMQVPWTIVTSGTVAIASARIKAAGIPKPAHLVTADDISHGKPHPEPYLKGASRLGIAPQDCLVFEDATAGIASGIAAGGHVIGVAATTTSSGQRSIPSILSYSQLAVQADGKDFLITID